MTFLGAIVSQNHYLPISLAKVKVSEIHDKTMFDLIKLVLELGLDVSSRAGVSKALALLGKDDSLTEDVYIALKNYLNKDGFARVDYIERLLFLPQCLRDSKRCKAELGEYGYECKSCGSCVIPQIKEEAKKLGYKGVYIVPGGSMVMRIVKKEKPKGVVGIACKLELCQAVEKLGGRIWAQGVPLLRDGCKDTAVDVGKVLSTLRK